MKQIIYKGQKYVLASGESDLFFKEYNDTLALSPKKLIKFLEGFSLAVATEDIRIKNDSVYVHFSSVSYDGSVNPKVLLGLEQSLGKLKHVDFVNINTDVYELRIDFDMTVEEYEVLPPDATTKSVSADSAGVFTLLKTIEVKDFLGKKVLLKKGTRLRHEKAGRFGPDYLICNLPKCVLDAGVILTEVLGLPE